MNFKGDQFERKTVAGSSQIIEIVYQKEKEKLWIRFYNDSIYCYEPFPKNMWADFKNHGKKGSYFYKFIKYNKNLITTKIDDGKKS